MVSDLVPISTATAAKACSSLTPISHNYSLHDKQRCTRPESDSESQSSVSKPSSSRSSLHHYNAATADKVQDQDAGRVSRWKCLMFLRTIWNLFAHICSRFNSNNTSPSLPDHNASFHEAPQCQSFPVLENEEVCGRPYLYFHDLADCKYSNSSHPHHLRAKKTPSLLLQLSDPSVYSTGGHYQIKNGK